ncbi:hypothetical protein EC844_107127 [Acinetobacter calcoaceticus]|uniref:Lipoprotein n=1 Tax=Acinetobacter calcoaceticus TaxID=471 RepID=A0A4R1XX19_ACICA|nr:hypothetical protein EC844_107127 [Acinetobacter calcoaceticus]
MKKIILPLCLLALGRCAFAEDCSKALSGQYQISKHANYFLEQIALEALESNSETELLSIKKQGDQSVLILGNGDGSAHQRDAAELKPIEIKTGSNFKLDKDGSVDQDFKITLAESLIAKPVLQCQTQLNDHVVLYKADLSKLTKKDLQAYSQFVERFYDVSADFPDEEVELTPQIKAKVRRPFSLDGFKKNQYFMEYTDELVGVTSLLFIIPLEKK